MLSKDTSMFKICMTAHSLYFPVLHEAETLEDLHDWKAALEDALSQAPSATLVMGQKGIYRNDQAEAFDGSAQQCMLHSFYLNKLPF
ncbi:Rho GTPase activation protein (RhoGAP) with PH domain-containing protein [Actinidia rufa]|uniref:Rho GTPase activation protein (RhoGAP) with PH domain-containing protein n=1 Tax=Actinidia rufa TaxID=165716 RepID=A0A7J0GH45_9ERIC|nr:Rho GTPase activation protein (RhoGAP) with PH domain-containing protein [Actinidia rufa]